MSHQTQDLAKAVKCLRCGRLHKTVRIERHTGCDTCDPPGGRFPEARCLTCGTAVVPGESRCSDCHRRRRQLGRDTFNDVWGR